MTMHVLIINPQLAFTVALKQALERTGSFAVHPFTSADAALEYLQMHAHDVAVIRADVTTPDGLLLARQLRDVQPDLPIIVSPAQPETILDTLRLQAGIDEPFQARDLIPLLNQAAGERAALAQTWGAQPPLPPDPEAVVQTTRFDQPPPAVQPEPDDTPGQFSSLDTVLDEENIFDLDLDAIEAAAGLPDAGDPPEPRAEPRPSRNFDDLLQSLRGDEPRKPLRERSQLIDFTLPGKEAGDEQPGAREPRAGGSLFRRLAEEEPPLPDLEANGTVGDLINDVVDSGFQDVLALLRGDDVLEASSPAAALSDEDLRSVLDSFYGGEDDSTPREPDDLAADAEPPRRDEAEGEPHDDAGRSPARLILETAFDESTPPEEFSLDELIENIGRRLPEHRPNVQPLPSWLRETEPIIVEPDFLPEEPSKVLPIDFTGDLSDQTTRPSGRQRVETRGGELETEMVDIFLDEELTVAPDALEPFDDFTPEPPAPDSAAPAMPAPMIGVPDDIDASVEPLLREKFAGGWADTGEVEVVGAAPEPVESAEPAELPEAWPEALTVDEAPFEAFETVAEQDAGPEPLLAAADPAEDEPEQPEPQPPGLPEEPPVWTGERLPPLVLAEEHQFDSALFDTNFDRLAAFDFPDAEILQLQPAIGARPLDEPRIAQAALSLTHASLESTAEATLLTRNGEIVAFAGELTREELEEVRRGIADDWDTSVENARLRFIMVESSGVEYMLYSRHTDDDLILSMLFRGATKLRDIRRQGDRLVQALQSVPETPAAEGPPPVAEFVAPPAGAEPAEAVALAPYTAVWVLAGPSAQLDDALAQALVSGLTTQLSERGWVVHEARAEYEYVMVYADMPAEQPQNELVEDLKQRAAAIAHAVDPALDPDALWADGYLLVAPGRELQLEDIQSYIEFERM